MNEPDRIYLHELLRESPETTARIIGQKIAELTDREAYDLTDIIVQQVTESLQERRLAMAAQGARIEDGALQLPSGGGYAGNFDAVTVTYGGAGGTGDREIGNRMLGQFRKDHRKHRVQMLLCALGILTAFIVATWSW